jgi:hypothetical protein
VADIAAANITLQERMILGNKLLWKAKVKGDGTGVTIPVPLGRIDSTWVGNVDETAGYQPAISTATNIVTYAAAPTINKYHWLFVLGSD